MTTLLDVAKALEGQFHNVMTMGHAAIWQKIAGLLPDEVSYDAAGPTATAVVRIYVFHKEPLHTMGILFIDKDGHVYVEGVPPVDALQKLRYNKVIVELRLKTMEGREWELEREVARGVKSEQEAYLDGFSDDDLPLLERPALNHEGGSTVH